MVTTWTVPAMDSVAERLRDAGGLDYAAAAVGEGHCPLSRHRLTPPVHVRDDGPRPGQDGTGRCGPCELDWATGTDATSGTWLAWTAPYVVDGEPVGTLELVLNPPPDPPDPDEWDWDE